MTGLSAFIAPWKTIDELVPAERAQLVAVEREQVDVVAVAVVEGRRGPTVIGAGGLCRRLIAYARVVLPQPDSRRRGRGSRRGAG